MMGEFFKRLFGRRENQVDPRKEIDALEADLNRAPSENDLATLVPIILPHDCLTTDWPGPIAAIGSLPFAIAWALIPEPNYFLYLTHERAALWEDSGIDWRAEAMRNLAQVSEGRHRWAGDKLDDDGKPFILALLFDDGFGPSRLLLPHLYDDLLGPDYRVAIPERTCAVAYRRELTPAQARDVDGIVEGCFRHGTEPMSNERFNPEDFWTEVSLKPA